MRSVIAGSASGALVALALAGCAPPAAPEGNQLCCEITVLAAASLTEVFESLATEFEARQPGVDVQLSFGGSSALAEQVLAGAPADLFAAANLEAMASVQEAGLASEPVLFATNSLELAVPAGNPGGVEDLADLARDDLVVALCDPSVPCGAAAADLLAAAGVVAAPDTLEENVKAVLTKVSLGEADAGLVYRTDVRAAGDAVEGLAVPGADQVRTEYPIAELADSRNPDAALAFLQFVTSERGREVLRDAGFGIP